jgi:hypothetical protein
MLEIASKRLIMPNVSIRKHIDENVGRNVQQMKILTTKDHDRNNDNNVIELC